MDPSIGTDNTTKENMEKLVKAGDDLLKQSVKVMDVTSFLPYEKPSEGTNAEALERFVAKCLGDEALLCCSNKNINYVTTVFFEGWLKFCTMRGSCG